MALHGTIIKLPSGNLAIECLSTHDREPKQIRHVWEFPTYRLGGMSYCSEQDAIGKPASVQDGRVNCYLGQGNALTANLPQGGNTQAVILEITDLPPPKTRGMETRWYNGRWEKYSKSKGWIVA